VPLVGAAVLTAFSVASLPWGVGWRLPRTPFDASASGAAVASGYVLLRNAAAAIPRDATVVVVTEPRDPTREDYFHRFAVALLPGVRAIPAGFFGPPADSEDYPGAEFLIVVGGRPSAAPGDLLLDTPEGTVWRRRPR